MEDKSKLEDYPISVVPQNSRHGFISIVIILTGFTFFSATMWAGGNLGTALPFWPDLIIVIIAGNILLACYVALLGYIAAKTGMNTLLMCRYCFGDWGSRWADLLLGVTQVGWYAWGTATIAVILTTITGIDPVYQIPLMVLFGIAFCLTAFIGYRGLERLSMVSVPMMTFLLLLSIAIGLKEAGGIDGVLSATGQASISFGAGVTIVVGTFIGGGTMSPNWTRFAKTGGKAVWASLIAFFFGNGLLVFAGAFGACIYQESDIVRILAMQGLLALGVVMLFANIWTTQDNTIYNFSVAGCNFFRSENRRLITVGGAVAGTIIAILGMYSWLIPFITMLGMIIPPLGGVIMADYFVKHRMRYPELDSTAKMRVNMSGIAAYILSSAIAINSPGIPPVNGVISAFILYILLDKTGLNERFRFL